jgi:dimethylhistidine N-methyltransferase
MHSSIQAGQAVGSLNHVQPAAAVPTHSAFMRDVQCGLAKQRKELPCKYLYDERGSQLFDQICELDEYYPTRVETEIMRASADDMAARIGQQAVIVEYGSGSSSKTRILLEHLVAPKAYLPVDISSEYLAKVARRLSREYPRLHIDPVVADFTQSFSLPAVVDGCRPCVYFPGSTIGNLERTAAAALLHQIAQQTARGGGLLIGIDLMKDESVLHRAYDDSQGVTAEFNRNLLRRINRELGANFQLEQFTHVAEVNTRAERVELYLESRGNQSVQVGEKRFHFRPGERIFTEYSHKYRVHDFAAMAERAGMSLLDVWTDERQYFAVLFLQTASS